MKNTVGQSIIGILKLLILVAILSLLFFEAYVITQRGVVISFFSIPLVFAFVYLGKIIKLAIKNRQGGKFIEYFTYTRLMFLLAFGVVTFIMLGFGFYFGYLD